MSMFRPSAEQKKSELKAKLEISLKQCLDFEKKDDISASPTQAVAALKEKIKKLKLSIKSEVLELCPYLELIPETHNFVKNRHGGEYIYQGNYDLSKVECKNDKLTHLIGNTSVAEAITLIEDKNYDINGYSPFYGDTPLMLAIAKGWNHIDTAWVESKGPQFDHSQRKIIEALFRQADRLDINAVNLINGMTALHIACLRGDDPKLIEQLLLLGAKIDCVDLEGRTPLDLLNCSYEATQLIISDLTWSPSRGIRNIFEGTKVSKSYVATLPTISERLANIEKIKKMLADKNIEVSAVSVERKLSR